MILYTYIKKLVILIRTNYPQVVLFILYKAFSLIITIFNLVTIKIKETIQNFIPT